MSPLHISLLSPEMCFQLKGGVSDSGECLLTKSLFVKMSEYLLTICYLSVLCVLKKNLVLIRSLCKRLCCLLRWAPFSLHFLCLHNGLQNLGCVLTLYTFSAHTQCRQIVDHEEISSGLTNSDFVNKHSPESLTPHQPDFQISTGRNPRTPLLKGLTSGL